MWLNSDSYAAKTSFDQSNKIGRLKQMLTAIVCHVMDTQNGKVGEDLPFVLCSDGTDGIMWGRRGAGGG